MQALTTVRSAIGAFLAAKGLDWPEKAVIEATKDPAHGDLATNVAMLLARPLKRPPREIAAELAASLKASCPLFASVEVAGPGFCNIRFAPAFWRGVIRDVERKGADYGSTDIGRGKRVMVEYVSANPTGPLHVGHGRGAAAGDSLARLLRRAGCEVTTEYYINDAGRQMRLLGHSVWYRINGLLGRPMEEPADWYKGAYIVDIARELLEREPGLAGMDGDEAEARCLAYAKDVILKGIQADLAEFRVEHQSWFSERSLVDEGKVERAFKALADAGRSYERDGALWFSTTAFGDDKDRVLRKSDGSLTYFASDIAYHFDKYARGYDRLIDVWGADHHGYVPRMRAAIAAMGKEQASFDVVLIQLVNLLVKGQPVSMSTRAGTFETLADVVKEVGVDAARFMFLSRKTDAPVDFDLEAVKQRSMENPVYYVQYAHARVRALLRRAEEEGLVLGPESSEAELGPLGNAEDLALLRKMELFPDTLALAAKSLSVHQVGHYLMELSQLLHSYYAKHAVLSGGDRALSLARLALLRAVARVVANGLELLGVEAPERM